MKKIRLTVIMSFLAILLNAQCITGTPPTLTCGTPISVADGTASGLYGTASKSAPACRGSEKYTWADLYQVTYQPGMVININCEYFIGFLEVLSADGCTSYGCNIVDASGINISGESFVQDATSLNGLLRMTIGLDGLGLSAGTTYLIKYASVANCGGSPCTSATVGTARAYTISCHTVLANACENNVSLSGNTTYTITNQYSSDDHSNLNGEGIDCGYSIESNLIYRWCTDASNTQVDVELTNVVIHSGTSIQFAILTDNCGGNYDDIQCQSGITAAQTFAISGTSANTCYWIALDGNAGTWYTVDIRLIDAIPMPIELIEFTATLYNKKVNIKWSTASEINNDYFNIERSKNGIDWYIIGTVKGKGNSNQISYYSFYDEKIIEGDTYYRLQQIDFDGENSYSHIVHINNTVKELKIKSVFDYTGNIIIDYQSYQGFMIILYEDGSTKKVIGKI